MKAAVDGTELIDRESYRVESQLFNLTLPQNNALGVQEGTTPAVSDGWFIMLEPLSKGNHTVEFSAVVLGPTGEQNFSTEALYNLVVH